jgi:hypothetical protein
MLAAYLLLLPHMPDSVRWTILYVGAKEMLGGLAGIANLGLALALALAIWRGEMGFRKRFDVTMKAVGL